MPWSLLGTSVGFRPGSPALHTTQPCSGLIRWVGPRTFPKTPLFWRPCIAAQEPFFVRGISLRPNYHSCMACFFSDGGPLNIRPWLVQEACMDSQGKKPNRKMLLASRTGCSASKADSCPLLRSQTGSTGPNSPRWFAVCILLLLWRRVESDHGREASDAYTLLLHCPPLTPTGQSGNCGLGEACATKCYKGKSCLPSVA